MIIDNEKNKPEQLKLHEWISQFSTTGRMDIVTGYFTVGALAWLSKTVNDKISEYRFVLGDIVQSEVLNDRTLDLLNENISIEGALKLNKLAKEAIEFLKQDKVIAKTLEPNFCHAKLYLNRPDENKMRDSYFVSGSSNLTEAGIGLSNKQNLELNIAENGTTDRYNLLIPWFEQLWNKEEANITKTIINEKGEKSRIPFKEYLINEIQKIVKVYTPRDLYYKVLWELFGAETLLEANNPEFSREIGHLENTAIYETLYEFQRKGVISMIQMLQNHKGAILADAVGLGKTWSALAVMKFFQKDHQVILLCPKKLRHNWNRYLKNHDSKFERDKLDFFIRHHTDLTEELMTKYNDRADKLFTDDKKKLIVIDESHNLRNEKSKRYKFLLESILQKNNNVKILMLSATPINNSLWDIRNQFNLIVKGEADGFKDLDINSLDFTFRKATEEFNKWREAPNPKLSDFIKALPDNFRKLTDTFIVARTRKMIEGQQTGLEFPQKVAPIAGGISENIFVTPKEMGNFESFEDLFAHFPPLLSGYQPSYYTESLADKKAKEKKRADAKKKGEKVDVNVLEDQQQRDKFLVKMMYILMVKRLESSWSAFYSTSCKILAHHQNAFNKIKEYQTTKKELKLSNEAEGDFSEDLEEAMAEFSLGKKEVKLSEIDAVGMLDHYKKDLKKDIEKLETITSNLKRFKDDIEKETSKSKNQKTEDDKLQALLNKIKQKRTTGKNKGNEKILIFTVYKDTAMYLYDQLLKRGFTKIAMVSGDVSKTDDSDTETKNFEPILERFAPYTKLFREGEWAFSPSNKDLSLDKQYIEWQEWVKTEKPTDYEKVNNPIDILIATDTLSEGQNLQDCDLVVNYDIHWNPVRVVQRMGRIDRLGSPNKYIYGVNFWPSNNINTYLNLQGRIEERMATMKLAGAEVDHNFTETFKEMSHDEELDNKMKARMIEQMLKTWDDIEVNDSGLSFNNLSLEEFRQDLFHDLKLDEHKYKNMPKGVFTGFKGDDKVSKEKGLIALLGYPAKPQKTQDYKYLTHELIYIDNDGKQVLLNRKEVLDVLKFHKENERFVPKEVDAGEEIALKKLSDSIGFWLKAQAVSEEVNADGVVESKMGKEALSIIQGLKTGNKSAKERIKQNINVSDKFKTENFDLITWFLIS